MINYPVSDLLPHKPPMVLLDSVVESSEDTIHTLVSICSGIPFFRDGVVPAYVAIEYMAQTIGAWNGLRMRVENKEPKVGFLLGTRELKLQVSAFQEGDELHVYGKSKYSDGEMASFECWVELKGEKVASAILNVFQPSNVQSFLK
jgi:predicted hotdog family 3-hydroxylacyl-ACP dehydratase